MFSAFLFNKTNTGQTLWLNFITHCTLIGFAFEISIVHREMKGAWKVMLNISKEFYNITGGD
jgi:hypothetical protein